MGAEIRGAILELGVHLWVARYAAEAVVPAMHGQWRGAIVWLPGPWLTLSGVALGGPRGRQHGPDFFRALISLKWGAQDVTRGDRGGDADCSLYRTSFFKSERPPGSR